MSMRHYQVLFSLLSCGVFYNSQAQLQQTVPPHNIYNADALPNDSNKVKLLIDYAEKTEGTNRDEALFGYHQAATLALDVNYFLGAGKALNYAGILYSDNGEYDEASRHYNQALSYYKKAAYKTGMASAYTNLGNIGQFRGEYKPALDYYLQAAALLEGEADSARLTLLYNNIGAVFSVLKSNGKAIEYSLKALAIAERAHSDESIINACINVSAAYKNSNDTVTSIQFLNRGLALAEKSNAFKTLNYLHNNLGAIYMEQGKTKQAVYHLQRASDYALKHGDPYDIASTYFTLSVFYKNAQQWPQAERYAQRALKTADSLQAHNLIAKTYNLLSDVEEHKGNYKKAYTYYIAYVAYNDSVKSKEQLQLVQEMEAKYQSTSKDKALSQNQLQIERSNAAINHKNNLILYFVSGIAILVLLLLLIYFYYRNKRKLSAQKMEAMERDKELKILQAMLEGEERERGRIAGQLHDGIGGMVSAIKMQLGVSKLEQQEITKSGAYQQALLMLDDMAKEVRKTAHNLMPEVLHKYGLEEAIRLYCNSVHNKNLEVHFQAYDVHNGLGGTAELLLYRMMQELLNNALKHAAATEILMDLAQDEKSITLTVEDNGKGFPDTATDYESGMGLTNIRSKVTALEGRMEVLSERGTGTTINIELPLQNLRLI